MEQTTASPLAETSANGYKIKDIPLIEKIKQPRVEEYRELQLYSWQCGRIIRRKFNRMMSRMFFLAMNRQIRMQLSDLIDDLEDDTVYLEHQVYRFDMPEDAEIYDAFTVRIVSDECLKLVNVFQRADKAIYLLAKNLTDQKEMNTRIAPFMDSFEALFHYVNETIPRPTKKETVPET